jgi:hypothetical protein
MSSIRHEHTIKRGPFSASKRFMSYYHSCSIYDLADTNHFSSFDYWHDWNASLLHAVVNYKLRSTTYDLLK